LKKLLSPHAKSKNIKLKIESNRILSKKIYTDRIKLYRILINLVNNALKFTQAGQVIVQAQVEQEETLVFTVTDTGIGIPEDKLNSVFEEFYYLNPTNNSERPGFGLGLFIVKKYVDLLKGTISASSQLGKGSQFIVRVPVALENEKTVFAEDKCVHQTPTLTSSSTARMKVLVVEDNHIARYALTTFLKDRGFEVHEAESAERAFNKVLANQYAFIVTDLSLDGMDGYQFTQLVREWERITAKSSALPIIGLPACDWPEEHTKAITSGMSLLLAKPINHEKIDQILKTFSTKVLEEALTYS